MQRTRVATPNDTLSVVHLQSLSYPPELIEHPDTFSNILAQGASFVYLSDPDDDPIAYILTHGMHYKERPPLFNHYEKCDDETNKKYDFWFIHDLTVHPHYRCRGIGEKILHRFFEHMHSQHPSIHEIYIISVDERSHHFWGRHGFIELPCDPAILQSYGQENPKYMVKYI